MSIFENIDSHKSWTTYKFMSKFANTCVSNKLRKCPITSQSVLCNWEKKTRKVNNLTKNTPTKMANSFIKVLKAGVNILIHIFGCAQL